MYKTLHFIFYTVHTFLMQSSYSAFYSGHYIKVTLQNPGPTGLKLVTT